MANVSMKLARDLFQLLQDTIILGADVTHTKNESPDAPPSLAAVVGSIDTNYGQFLGSLRLQKRNQEIIDEFEKIVTERLQAWKARNKGKLPSKVLYYRDGVGESQHSQIRMKDVQKIRGAYQKLQVGNSEPIEPLITAVVVTKRHHTRFYPLDKDTRKTPPTPFNSKGKNPRVGKGPQGKGAQGKGQQGKRKNDADEAFESNCLSGTVIETDVTHPYYFDFFLQSHTPIQGTARPTHYFVLENGMTFTAAQLQEFTYKLCFTYARATLPVGYVPPAYYADRLCDRARAYMKRNFTAHEFEKWTPPSKDPTESRSDYNGRKKGEREAYEEQILQKWKNLSKSSDDNPEGPWHKNLNDTMFWM
ncbi:stem cell self-renewal protein Piwi [Sporormia fimetaria CBS 119925]|uniref:Stem cell self-renewal protein Piwi n=1 Tax=Sporormia fimetaria CBS 119925 TaxID=1340428 RepID=A0A6A6V2G9_9PLEO|nr:stem cell self-renewal protein Piwi [Sporormia fimetaria CBS 119925]